MEFVDMEAAFIFIDTLDVDFNQTWSAIGGHLQHKILRESFQSLKNVSDYSDFHQRIYVMLLGIYQNLILEAENSAWEILHSFVVDETLTVSRQNNVVWIVLGLVGQLLGHHTTYVELVNDCIYMLFKTMTTGVQLDQVSLNISYYKNLDANSTAKQAGIGLFSLLGINIQSFWPICCRQLQRLMDEKGGLLKTIKILIGLFDYRHCEELVKENTQECDDLVANIFQRAGQSMVLNLDIYVNWIQQAHMRDNCIYM